MSIAQSFWITAALLFVWTIRNLPFISLDAALYLQMEIQRLKRWLVKKAIEQDIRDKGER